MRQCLIGLDIYYAQEQYFRKWYSQIYENQKALKLWFAFRKNIKYG